MTGCSNGVKAGAESCRNGMAGTAAPMSTAVMTACRPGPGGSGIDRADAAVRHRTAQDHGVQEILAHEVVDELAAPAQQAKILDAFDRAPDEGVGRALLIHVR